MPPSCAPSAPRQVFFLLLRDLGVTKNLEDMIKPWPCLAVIMVNLWGLWLGRNHLPASSLSGGKGKHNGNSFFFFSGGSLLFKSQGRQWSRKILGFLFLGQTPRVGGGLHLERWSRSTMGFCSQSTIFAGAFIWRRSRSTTDFCSLQLTVESFGSFLNPLPLPPGGKIHFLDLDGMVSFFGWKVSWADPGSLEEALRSRGKVSWVIYSFFFLYTFGEIGGENRGWGQHVFLPFNGTLLSCWGKAGEREKKDKGSLIIFSVGWI